MFIILTVENLLLIWLVILNLYQRGVLDLNLLKSGIFYLSTILFEQIIASLFKLIHASHSKEVVSFEGQFNLFKPHIVFFILQILLALTALLLEGLRRSSTSSISMVYWFF